MAFTLEKPIGTGTDRELLTFALAAVEKVTWENFKLKQEINRLKRKRKKRKK